MSPEELDYRRAIKAADGFLLDASRCVNQGDFPAAWAALRAAADRLDEVTL